VTDAPPLFVPDDPDAVACYRTAIRALTEAGIEFLIGGAYSFFRYTGIARHTKDLDVFLRKPDRDLALAALAAAGFHTDRTYSHWLAKAFRGGHFIDLIYGSGNGLGPVNDGWFADTPWAEVFGEPVRLLPAEEAIWSKAFIMERHRFDGADVVHILRACGPQLNWHRLLARFGPHWRVLYAHLVLFGYVYPGERDQVPGWVMEQLTVRLTTDGGPDPAGDHICRGTLLSAVEYRPDVERWRYADALLAPSGPLTTEQVTAWTNGVVTGK
jgi:hypothetical protein